jgi:hypothetical protein
MKHVRLALLWLSGLLLGALLTIACAEAKKPDGKLAATVTPKVSGTATAATPAGIALQAPITITESVVAVQNLRVSFGATDTQTQAQLMYRAVDASGNPLQGSPPVVVQLTAADLALFQSTPGSFRLGALAALQHNQPQLAGTAQ